MTIDGNAGSQIGRYFEDFTAGDTFITPSRTVTEADVSIFAGLSGDYNPLHTDDEYARKTSYGRRIAHGPLGIALVSGLTSRLSLFERTAIAFLELNWKFTAPIFIGDTVHAEITIAEMRETRNAERGVLVRVIRLVNQSGAVVQEGTSTIMIARRPDSRLTAEGTAVR